MAFRNCGIEASQSGLGFLCRGDTQIPVGFRITGIDANCLGVLFDGSVPVGIVLLCQWQFPS